MRDDPAAEAYERGAIKIGENTWPDVGIRFKGFYGSLRQCLLGTTTCHQLSYKIKFDYVNPARAWPALLQPYPPPSQLA